MSPVVHKGGCHCGRVTFEVEASSDIRAFECNCSICSKSGYLHLIVSAPQFRLLSGAENLSSYRFNTEAADHLFCRTCGVKSFYVPRSHPEGYSVNVRCLDKALVKSIEISPFNGANWEQHVEELHGL